MSPEEEHRIFYKDINNINTLLRSEILLSSWIRNTIILISLAITLLSFSKNKYKNEVSNIIFILGLIVGIIALFDYYKMINKVRNSNYKLESQQYSYNFLSSIFILIILSIFVSSRIFNYYLL